MKILLSLLSLSLIISGCASLKCSHPDAIQGLCWSPPTNQSLNDFAREMRRNQPKVEICTYGAVGVACVK